MNEILPWVRTNIGSLTLQKDIIEITSIYQHHSFHLEKEINL